VVFRSGNLNRAIRASFSIPVVLRPVREGDMLLMDGGIANPLPLNRVERRVGDILVSVNVSAPWDTHEPSQTQPKQEDKSGEQSWLERLLEQRDKLFSKQTEGEMSSLTVLGKVSDVMIQQHGELMKQLCPPDINVDVAINQFGSFDYDRAEEIIRYGFEKMNKAIDAYESL
jgi:NTE family protein